MNESQLKSKQKIKLSRETAFASVLTIFIAAIIVTLWLLARNSEDNRLRAMTRVTAEQMKTRLESWINTRLSVVHHLGGKWYFEYKDNPQKYAADVKKFIDLYPGFQAINWVDRDYTIRRIVPVKGNEAALDKNLLHHPSPGVSDAILKAAHTGKLIRTPAIDLLQGGRGFAAYFPIYDSQKNLAGFINGVFVIDTLVNQCFSEKSLRDKFRFSIYENSGLLIYRHPPDLEKMSEKFRAETPLRIVDKTWKLCVSPSAKILNPGYYRANFIALFWGLVLALATGYILRYALKSRRDIKKSETRFQAFMAHLPAGVFIKNQDGLFTFANQFLIRNFGADQWLNQSPEALKNDSFAKSFQSAPDAAANTDTSEKEITLPDKNGNERIYHTIQFPIQLDETTSITGGIVWDVTQRRKAEMQLRRSVEEKELLLKEIHHRVKNNLQVVMSLLYLQSKKISDRKTAEIFRLNRNRIRSMALVHERLYKSKNFAKIDFHEYIHTIVRELINSYSQTEKVTPHIQADKIHLEIDRAISLGLLLNEIVSNSLKHAFPNKDNGNLHISATLDVKTNMVTLSVKDDGVGLPDDIKGEESDSLGMSLIHTLVDQIQGKIEIKREDGTKFIISFPTS
ncbi:MAG: PAS domain-containing protein [Calditrichaeota bacterium]|nr:PAS domain-containing protein [Calditrichota bacterium]